MPKTLAYSIIMFLAGCCYGVSVPLVRVIAAQGLSTPEIMALQYLVGLIILTIAVIFFFRRRISAKNLLALLGVGVLAAGVSYCYYRALSVLPSATALTLLFQFVWMGVVVQIIRERKLPKAVILISVLFVMAGTVLTTGVLEEAAFASNLLDPVGILFGFLSAAFYTSFITASGKVALSLPAVNRTHVTAFGSFVVALILCPSFFTDTVAPNISNIHLVAPGVALGIFGILLPVFLVAVSSPHLPNGLAAIMAASELPSGILCAMVFMGDTISLPVACGVVIILAGIVLSQAPNLLEYYKEKKRA